MATNLLTTGLNYTASPQMSEMDKIVAGSLEAFIARDANDLLASQRLRYRVFVEEMGAKASPEMHAGKIDFDEFDDICDHLLIVDNEKNGKVVGSYRLLRRSRLPKGRRFYTEGEYDITKALAHFKGEVMELGRSCVDKDYRNRASIQLLWRAIGDYTSVHNVKLMFGCASFPGSDHKLHAKQLAYLYHYHLAPDEFRARALPDLFVPMNLYKKEDINAKEVLNSLPPLIKGYLRVGGFVGDGAFEDHAYNTTDVCIIVDTALITDKYLNRYVTK
jgi:putative hemolysin